MPALHITGISLSTSMMKFKSDAAFWNVPHGHQEIFGKISAALMREFIW